MAAILIFCYPDPRRRQMDFDKKKKKKKKKNDPESSEEKSFENVDGRMTDDRLTMKRDNSSSS